MAFYGPLKHYVDDPEEPPFAPWIAERLISLRAELNRVIRAGRRDNSLLIGSWNIRAFDDGRPRRHESFHYIAEIIDHFDICAVQEVKRDLAPLKRLVDLLGPNWDYFVSDITDGSRGNNERMAFLYNKNRVMFRNLVGEIVLPKDELLEGEQIARSPYFASFQAGWFKFTLCNMHVIFAGSSRADKVKRAREISVISKLLAERSVREDEVYVLLGDMNIETVEDDIMGAMTAEGLHAPHFGPTNLKGTKSFDQIAFTQQDVKTKLLRSGSFDWRTAVFRDTDKAHYKAIAERARGEPYADWDRSYEGWTSFEMSDHLPIWLEIEVDYSDDYLRRFVPIGP